MFESEFWPSTLYCIKRKNIPLILVNGRISNKSFKRWQQFDFVIKDILDCFTLCLGQSEQDEYRLRVLGAKNTLCLGNLKYAGLPLPVDETKKQEIAEQMGNRPVWLVSSTHEDEEFKIGRFLNDLNKKIPNLLTFIAPRHPHRGVEIKERLQTIKTEQIIDAPKYSLKFEIIATATQIEALKEFLNNNGIEFKRI